ncbi:MAG: HNH endonuclease [Youngiibacter sp.]|nr:HNH endonuclease [Youngiibacter sp.]
MAREFAKRFYKSKQWKNVRKYVLMRDKYLCVKCGQPAEEVHHIVMLTPENIGDPAISMSDKNLISLCRDCHFREHKEHRLSASGTNNLVDGYVFDDNGQVIPAGRPMK